MAQAPDAEKNSPAKLESGRPAREVSPVAGMAAVGAGVALGGGVRVGGGMGVALGGAVVSVALPAQAASASSAAAARPGNIAPRIGFQGLDDEVAILINEFSVDQDFSAIPHIGD